jgi:hypothetical protein
VSVVFPCVCLCDVLIPTVILCSLDIHYPAVMVVLVIIAHCSANALNLIQKVLGSSPGQDRSFPG